MPAVSFQLADALDVDAGPNDSGPMALEHAINMAKTEEERRGTAMKAKTLISEQVSMSEGVTMWCDAMDDWAEAAFGAQAWLVERLCGSCESCNLVH